MTIITRAANLKMEELRSFECGSELRRMKEHEIISSLGGKVLGRNTQLAYSPKLEVEGITYVPQ